MVILAVKPQIMPVILKKSLVVNSETLVISLPHHRRTLQRACDSRRVVRVMPNTPALVLAGAAGISQAAATAQDIALVERLFNAVGRAMVVVTMMDVSRGSVAAVQRSFLLLKGSDGGVLMGLARPTAPS